MLKSEIDFEICLNNESVELRPLKITDTQSLANLTSDPTMWTYFTNDLSNETELKKWVNDALNETKEKKKLAFAIIDKKHNRIAGSTSFGNISCRDKRLEIGWTWIGKEFQGTGINDQMKYLMLEYCFDVLNFERVELKTDVLNIPARKAMLRIGLKEEGILRSHTLMTNNRRRDTIYYSLLKSEWSELKSSIPNKKTMNG